MQESDCVGPLKKKVIGPQDDGRWNGMQQKICPGRTHFWPPLSLTSLPLCGVSEPALSLPLSPSLSCVPYSGVKQEDVGWGRITRAYKPSFGLRQCHILFWLSQRMPASPSQVKKGTLTKCNRKIFSYAHHAGKTNFKTRREGREGRGEQRKKYQRTGGSYPTGSRPPSPPPRTMQTT